MRVFECARKIRSNGKLFPLTVKYAFWPCKSISIFILPSNHFRNSQIRKERKKDSQMQWNDREREKEERVGRVSSGPTPDTVARLSPNPDIAARSRRWVRDAKFSIRVALVFNPKLIGVVVTDLVLVLDPKLIDITDLVVSISSHQWSRHLDLVSVSSSSLFPWSFRSLSLPPSLSLTKFVWSSMNCFEQISVSLKCLYWNFCNKICLDAEKMIEKMWKICRKIVFSECYQILKMVF